MKKLFWLAAACALCLLLTSVAVPANSAREPGTREPATPAEQAHRFLKFLSHEKVDEATALLAFFDLLPEEAQARVREELGTLRRMPMVLGHLRLQDAAVVITFKRRAATKDADPLYLVRRHSGEQDLPVTAPEWRVLPGLDDFTVPGVELDAELTRQLNRLQSWYLEQKAGFAELVRSEKRAAMSRYATENASGALRFFFRSLKEGNAERVAFFLSRTMMLEHELEEMFTDHAVELAKLAVLDAEEVQPTLSMEDESWRAVFQYPDGPKFVLLSTDHGDTWFLEYAKWPPPPAG